MRIIRLDEALTTWLAAVKWPPGVPAPAVDLTVAEDGEPRIRFVAVAMAPSNAPADFSSVGGSPFEMIAAIGLLSEAWTRRHGGDPGVYPTGVKAQIVNRLDLRTAGSWVYSIQLATALSVAAETVEKKP